MADENPDEETRPLLVVSDEGHTWKPPRRFLWIECAILVNVFLNGFDGTITAGTYEVISSEFNAANSASWLTTSYLITSTAFQPLYGRFSDVFGRRICFFVSTISFALGCLGCATASNVVMFDFMRALTGFGGGGLMTMATIINSDLIPFQRRGMYQALQNAFFGSGAICGASLGGLITDTIGWRWCFYLQIPLSAFAVIIGWSVLQNQGPPTINHVDRVKETWRMIDLSGAMLLVAAVSIQLVGLSLGGNELEWSNRLVLIPLATSLILFVCFFALEAKTTATPILPTKFLRGRLPVSVQVANFSAGLAAYGYLFMLPLYFQVVLLDSPSVAGARLAIPSLGTPLGGLVAGLVMSRYGKLLVLVRIGALLMFLGNVLVATFRFHDTPWKYVVYIFVPNFGQGMVYPSILFVILATFDHSDHAISTSSVYLIRSLGSVWGVAVTSAIVQTTLQSRLPMILDGVEKKEQIIEAIRHSVSELRALPSNIQRPVRLVYYHGIQYAFATTTCFAAVAVVASLLARADALRSTHK